MRNRCFRFAAVAIGVFMVPALMAAPAAGQSAGDAAGGSYEAPRLPWGDPDLQSIWTSSGETPMERPEEYVGRETLTDEEVAAIRGDIEARNERLLNADAQRTQAGGNIGAYNNFWMDRGARTNRTSMIVDPPDGRFPPLTPRGQIAAVSQPRGDNVPADRHIWERCVTRGGMPNAMFPRSYNNNMQLFQTPDHVVMLLEQVHEVRVVPLGDDGAAVSSRIGQWNGLARGRWDGDTLEVVTTNLDPRVSGLQPWSIFNSHDGSGEGMTLIERFTRTGPNSLEYEIEVHDPEMYTRPWTVAYPFATLEDVMYEYACHEGNIGMEGILAGGRAEDAEASR